MIVKNLPLAAVRIDGDTQPRADMDWDYVGDIIEVLESGVTLADPLDVFYDGKDYWLADGFHRYHAHTTADAGDPLCRVHKGTVLDAQWFACQANRSHGLRRTNADKKNAVLKALEHPEGKGKSDRAIAEHCGVSDHTVAKYRDDDEFDEGDSGAQFAHLDDGEPPVRPTRKGKDGKDYPAPKGKTRAPAAPVKDQLGHVVTAKGAQVAFSSGLSAIYEAQAAIQKVRKLVKDVCTGPAGVFLSASRVDVDLKNAWQALKHGKPYTVTPPSVKEKRWRCGYMNRTDYDNLPAENKHT